MTRPFPIPIHLMYCRHRLPGEMRPKHTDLIVHLTPQQFKEWQESEDAHGFACEILHPDLEPYYVSGIGPQGVSVLEDAFDDWWIGHRDCIFDVGVYTLERF